MQTAEIQRLIETGLTQCTAYVDGDGRHFEAAVISPAFAGKSVVQQHQMVYALVREQMDNDTLHALSLRTYTPEAWAAREGQA